MAAYGTMDAAIAGLFSGFDNRVDSVIAQEDIAYGAPVFGFVGSENKGYAAHTDVATTLLDADLIASNVLTTTINGIAVASTYATSHAASMTAHIAAINADTDVIALGVSAAASGARGIVITAPAGLSLAVTQAVTLGSTQAGATVVLSSNGKFLGVAMFIENGSRTMGAGNAKYEDGMSVSVLNRGKIWVLAAATVADKDPAYIISGGSGTVGTFTDVSTNNIDIGAYFASSVTGGLALLDVRGRK